ncbi:HMG-Y-related protein A [Dendrobium catenatum]|uniref:HMG-Y-related protein A n=1 Tax=Dendrobium catenatum TaxID=906689 RepID=A0A2I0VZ44_9ASPA|nr:HMG-Y-related protein A [Dendrobium catenatum]PKU68670.1 HMG-Y-related protein A [Dendrobium catenatum]
MATAEEENKAASHPAYYEMILGAITELGEKDGSSKLAISKQIEATYGDRLPEDHSAVLSESLAKLKESGKLLFVNNNYLKPDTDAQPRRGRGRPPKPKPDVPEGPELQSTKQRSLPAKENKPVSASSGKKRGRPPKGSNTNGDSAPEIAGITPTGPKRGRGRPPKVSSSTEVSVE